MDRAPVLSYRWCRRTKTRAQAGSEAEAGQSEMTMAAGGLVIVSHQAFWLALMR